MQVAGVCGKVAGIGRSLSVALESIKDAESRIAASVATTGILAQGQSAKLRDVSAELRALMSTVEDCWRVVEGIVEAGIAKPKRQEPDLL